MYAKPKSRRRKRLKRNRLYLMAAIFAVCCGGLTVAATLRALLAADEPATAVAPAFSDPVGPLLLRGTSDSSDYASASRGEGEGVVALPCLIAKTTTVPAFRICTVDPEGAGSLEYGSPAYWSKLVHLSGSARLMSHWPLLSLLTARPRDRRDPSSATTISVVDVGASIGYFSLEAATLNARVKVTAIERELPLVSLIRTSLALNEQPVNKELTGSVDPIKRPSPSDRFSNRVKIVHATAGDGEGESIALDDVLDATDINVRVLRIAASRDANAIVRGAHELLSARKVRYVFLDFSPSKLHLRGEDPIALLVRLKNVYHFNVFADRTAESGALLEKEFASLVKGIGKETRTIFLAQAF